MPAFTHTYGRWAVKGSFNKWFADSIDDQGLPSWMAAAVVNFDYPATPITFPSFSVTWLGRRAEQVSQGEFVESSGGTRYKGQRWREVIEVRCWETRDGNPSWEQRLEQMADMVTRLLQGTKSVAVNDLYAGTASPSATGAILRVVGIEETAAPHDPNVGVEQRRFIVTATWVERWS